MARPAASVGHGNDFHTSGGFPKNDQVRKPPEQHSACTKFVFRKLLRVICYFSMARSSSSRNISAARTLRRPYHSVAASASSTAAGSIRPTACLPLPSRQETAALLFPGDKRNGSAVDLLKTPLDLVPPGFLGAIVHRLIETADQRVDQRRANFRR